MCEKYWYSEKLSTKFNGTKSAWLSQLYVTKGKPPCEYHKFLLANRDEAINQEL